MDERVTVQVDGGVADVRLNRPEKMNALDPAMFKALVETGEPTVYDAGTDLIRCFVPAPGSAAFDVVPVARKMSAPAVNDQPGTAELLRLLDRAFGNEP